MGGSGRKLPLVWSSHCWPVGGWEGRRRRRKRKRKCSVLEESAVIRSCLTTWEEWPIYETIYEAPFFLWSKMALPWPLWGQGMRSIPPHSLLFPTKHKTKIKGSSSYLPRTCTGAEFQGIIVESTWEWISADLNSGVNSMLLLLSRFSCVRLCVTP